MDEDIRRVAGLILEAPLTRRNRRELLYCGLGGLVGALGFLILVALLAFGLTVSVSVLGTVVGLLLINLTLRLSRRIGSLHRRLSNRILGQQVEAPPRFQPGTGALGLGAVIRHTAGAISAVVGILFVLPLILVPLGTSIQNSVGQFMPMLIAENSLSAVKPVVHSLSPAVGLGMLCLYAVAALAAGTWALARRDA